MTHPRQDISRRSILQATALIGAGAFEILNSTMAEAATSDIQHGPRSVKKVALTFHGAGAPDFADPLLKLFKSSDTKVSVFAVGTWLVSEPMMAARIVDEGHDLGNHTMTHTQMKTISAKRVENEISGCAKELKKLIGNHGAWFRPSGTQFSTPTIRKEAIKQGYGRCISYEVDSEDFKDVSKSKMISNVMNNVKNGSIISMHFGHKVTLDAMPTILEKLHTQGLEPVTLTELLNS
jgi:peptidoglycan/xylan/chitin deacetylase (PgdA/CDA1 family)